MDLPLAPVTPPAGAADGPLAEIAAILAAGYLRLRLGTAPNATTPDVSASCAREKGAPESEIRLERSERKSVHGRDAINDEKQPGTRRARPR